MENVIAVRLKDVPVFKKMLAIRAILSTAVIIANFWAMLTFNLQVVSIVFVPIQLYFFYSLYRCGIRWTNLLELERLLIKKAKEKSIVKDAGLWSHAKKDEETTPQ